LNILFELHSYCMYKFIHRHPKVGMVLSMSLKTWKAPSLETFWIRILKVATQYRILEMTSFIRWAIILICRFWFWLDVHLWFFLYVHTILICIIWSRRFRHCFLLKNVQALFFALECPGTVVFLYNSCNMFRYIFWQSFFCMLRELGKT
jgi:hypothetical protein